MDEREIRDYIPGCFAACLERLGDPVARISIIRRLDRVSRGNFGDRRFVGGGVWELRIHVGPGYRVYYAEDGPTVVVLGVGEKSTQARDIQAARRRWFEYRGTK